MADGLTLSMQVLQDAYPQLLRAQVCCQPKSAVCACHDKGHALINSFKTKKLMMFEVQKGLWHCKHATVRHPPSCLSDKQILPQHGLSRYHKPARGQASEWPPAAHALQDGIRLLQTARRILLVLLGLLNGLALCMQLLQDASTEGLPTTCLTVLLYKHSAGMASALAADALKIQA